MSTPRQKALPLLAAACLGVAVVACLEVRRRRQKISDKKCESDKKEEKLRSYPSAMVKRYSPAPDFKSDTEYDIGRDNWDKSEYLALTQTQMYRFFPATLEVAPGPTTAKFAYHTKPWDVTSFKFVDPLLPHRTISGEQLLNRRLYNDGLLVYHKGSVVHESYRNGFRASDRHVIHSCSKSLCAMVCAKAIDEKLLVAEKLVVVYLPEFACHAAWQQVTVQHLLDMQAGVEYSEEYDDPQADYWSYTRAAGYYKPTEQQPAIGVRPWMIKHLQKPQYAPGTAFVYNSCLNNVLAMVLEAVYNCSLAELLHDKLYRHVGAEQSALFNTDYQEFGIIEGQINLCLRDLARVGILALNEGVSLSGERVLPESFFQRTYQPDAALQTAFQAHHIEKAWPHGQYHNQFWVFEPEKKRYGMLGIHGQFVWIDKERELMIVGQGSYPHQHSQLMTKTLETLCHGIAHYASIVANHSCN